MRNSRDPDISIQVYSDISMQVPEPAGLCSQIYYFKYVCSILKVIGIPRSWKCQLFILGVFITLLSSYDLCLIIAVTHIQLKQL